MTSLSAKDKETVRIFWKKLAPKAEVVGADALSRMLAVYPQTKTYFSHWKDLGPDSPAVRKHGRVIMAGIGEAVTKIDDLTNGLLALSELHAFNLRVDPTNFRFLSSNIMVVMAIMFPKEFSEVAHLAIDKFLAAVAQALSEKYR